MQVLRKVENGSDFARKQAKTEKLEDVKVLLFAEYEATPVFEFIDYIETGRGRQYHLFLSDRGLNPVLTLMEIIDHLNYSNFILHDKTIDQYSCSGYWFCDEAKAILGFFEGDIYVDVITDGSYYERKQKIIERRKDK